MDLIRRAARKDLPELLRMGRAFHSVTGIADMIPLDEETLARTFVQLMDGETATLLVVEGGGRLIGATGALLHPHYWNANHLTGQELFWWVDPEHRGCGGALFDALEAWARGMGASTFGMIALEAIENGRAGAIYRRRGYRPVEHSYLREF